MTTKKKEDLSGIGLQELIQGSQQQNSPGDAGKLQAYLEGWQAGINRMLDHQLKMKQLDVSAARAQAGMNQRNFADE